MIFTGIKRKSNQLFFNKKIKELVEVTSESSSKKIKNVLIFSDFKGDNFLSGNVQKIEFDYLSQKEGITFKDNNTLLITDEKSGGTGGNLYELKFN